MAPIANRQCCPVCRGRGHNEGRKSCDACHGEGSISRDVLFFPSSHDDLAGNPVLWEFLRSAIDVSHSDFGNIQLFDPGRGALRITVQQGFRKDFLTYFAEVKTGNTTCGAAMKRLARVVMPDSLADPIFNGKPAGAVMEQANALAVQSTPLLSSVGQFLGVISTHYRQPRDFPQSELEELDRVTGHFVARIEEQLRAAAVRKRKKSAVG